MPFVKTDKVGIIIEWDKDAENLFGWKSSEAVGQSVAIIIPVRFRIAHEIGIRRFAQTHISRGFIGTCVQVFGIHKNGNELPISIQLTIEDDTFLNEIHDLSEQRKKEDEMRILEDIPMAEPFTFLIVEPSIIEQQRIINAIRELNLLNKIFIAVNATEALDFHAARNRFFGLAKLPYIVITEQILPDILGSDLVKQLTRAKQIIYHTRATIPENSILLSKPISSVKLAELLPITKLSVY